MQIQLSSMLVFCSGCLRRRCGSYRYPGHPDVCHDVPTNAVSAAIEREDGDGDNYNVAFWKDGCNKWLQGSGDGGGGCTNFASAQWFSVREDWTVPGQEEGA
ncbi:hypothetical protein B0T14DRAFT_563803 [Immersiella caudata]|uniref:Uncharacterized protein n=1 Tax=Immersiella caudata TaxID=314043 RepID=A0AA39WVF5_9PEZI|nr:hypothetical protein B0T14DRAFT_563803 [Immersiella caudata]